MKYAGSLDWHVDINLFCNVFFQRNHHVCFIIRLLQATKDIESGQTLLVGGFGLCGIPSNLINAINKQGQRDLTVVSNNCGVDDWGLGVMLRSQ